MAFSVRLSGVSMPVVSKRVERPAEDFTSLIVNVCEHVSDTDCQFLVSGFGDDHWPVDIDYDLATVLEQLPGLVEDVRERRPGVLDFYEQGIQRRLDFSHDVSRVRITCRSGTGWVPNPTVEYADPDDLQNMLITLASDFATILTRVSPDLARLPPIPDWRQRHI